jgi:hypothetical protein
MARQVEVLELKNIDCDELAYFAAKYSISETTVSRHRIKHFRLCSNAFNASFIPRLYLSSAANTAMITGEASAAVIMAVIAFHRSTTISVRRSSPSSLLLPVSTIALQSEQGLSTSGTALAGW